MQQARAGTAQRSDHHERARGRGFPTLWGPRRSLLTMSARRTRRPLRSPLRLQALEGRIAPATFTVTNNNNTGSGSLRQAVTNANSASGTDQIDFSSYFNVPRTITLASEISITGAVTIDGPSAANVIISGNNAVRIFNTQSAPAGTSINLVDLTLTAGHVVNNEAGGAV